MSGHLVTSILLLSSSVVFDMCQSHQFPHHSYFVNTFSVFDMPCHVAKLEHGHGTQIRYGYGNMTNPKM